MEFSESYFEDEVREGFYIPSLMKRAWAAQMEVLEVVKNICEKHGIPLFAEWGTLLGAVRHGGRIPWDDDIDVCMLRKDYERFCEVVEEELPEECWFLNATKFNGFDMAIGRIINSKVHIVEGENLAKYHGFPYVAGIDIFWLDSLSNNAETRKRNQKEIQEIYHLLTLLQYEEQSGNKIPKQQLLYSVSLVEEICQVSLKEKKLMQKQLLQLLYEKTMEMGVEESVEVTNVYLWRENEKYRLPKSSYEKGVFLPFENTQILVPNDYEKILAIKYGENWREPIQTGGLHDYPSYAKQQDFLCKEKAGELFEFAFSEEERRKTLSHRTKKMNLEEKVRGFLLILEEAQEELELAIQKERWGLVCTLLEECQKVAIEIGTEVEKKKGESCRNVKRWEEYCECIYQIHTRVAGKLWEDVRSFSYDVMKSLDTILDEMEKHLSEELQEKKEVVFLPYKASLWESMKPMWEEAVADDSLEVSVVPIPYYYKDAYGKAKKDGQQYETSGYPEEVVITHYEDYDISIRRPDRIVIQCPYDEYNYGMTVHPFFYAKNLVLYTNELVYVPGLLMNDVMQGMDRAKYNLKSYCNMPGVVYSDKVFVQSERMREVYIDLLTEFAGKSTKGMWEKKIGVFTPHLATS